MKSYVACTKTHVVNVNSRQTSEAVELPGYYYDLRPLGSNLATNSIISGLTDKLVLKSAENQ